MKKLLLLVLLVGSLFAEMSFDQVQGLIKNKQYSEALIALDIIDKLHPNESIVYYTRAQAYAGFGDLRGAKIALTKAEVLNSKLSYAKPEAVKALKVAIEPRTNLIQTFERADKPNYSLYGFILMCILVIVGFWFIIFKKDKDDDIRGFSADEPKTPVRPNPSSPSNYNRTPFEDRVILKSPSYYEEQNRSTTRPETFARGYEEVHHHHNHSFNNSGNAGNTIVAGLAGAALGATVANLMNKDSHETYQIHEEVKSEPIKHDYFAKSYNEPEVKDNSWKGSNDDTTNNSWFDSNETGSSSSSSSSSWGDSNDSSGSSSWGDSNASGSSCD